MDGNDRVLGCAAVLLLGAQVVSMIEAYRAAHQRQMLVLVMVALCWAVPNAVMAGVAAVRRNRSGWRGVLRGGVIPGAALAWLRRAGDSMDDAAREIRRVRTCVWAAWTFAALLPFGMVLGLLPKESKTPMLVAAWLLTLGTIAMIGALIARLQGHKTWHGVILSVLLWPAIFVLVCKRGALPVRD
jgi:hypothetical protein